MPLRDTDELLPMVRDMVSYSRPEHVFRQVERLNVRLVPHFSFQC